MDAIDQTTPVRDAGQRDALDASFREAYEEHRAELLRYVGAWTRDPGAAEDICQEAFTRLYGAFLTGRVPDVPAAWLRRVSRNLVISRARRAEVESRHSPRLRETPGHDPTASLVLEHERLDSLEAALTRIPEAQRHLLLLAASGYSRAQIGRRVAASAGAVRTRLHRARRLLSAELEAGPLA